MLLVWDVFLEKGPFKGKYRSMLADQKEVAEGRLVEP